MLFDGYETGGFHDEMFKADGTPRPYARLLVERIGSVGDEELRRYQQAAEQALFRMGITFNVYGDKAGTEKICPFDIIPRIVAADEWAQIDRGLRQRVHALNIFINDIYHGQKILKDGIVPSDLILSAKSFRKACVGLKPPKGTWCHITGTDLVRDGDGKYYVLEDNLRCPSGVSYVLQNREIMKRTFPKIFEKSKVRPVGDYPSHLLRMLQDITPHEVESPTAALLTAGIYNSAYFEHAFLAKFMGIELVEGRDLVVMDGYVMMRTTKGFQRVDVIYRRIDDDFLDPHTFRADSLLGVT
jgi:uncharacterized circularly permuted ATP-grasp superfamily protein